MTDQDIYLLYSSQWRTLDDSIDDLTRQAQNFVEADKLINAWETAENNYSRARRLIFTSHTAQIQLIWLTSKVPRKKLTRH